MGYTIKPPSSSQNIVSMQGYVTATLIMAAPSRDPMALQEGQSSRYEAAVRARRRGGLALKEGVEGDGEG